MKFHKRVLELNIERESDRIVRFLQRTVRQEMTRSGGVVGVSGGIDSAVVLSLAARAFGPGKVLAVMMPDKDSDPISETLAREVAGSLGVQAHLEDMTETLTAFGCYRRRDEAIRRVFPDYDPGRGYKAKIVLPQDLLERGTLNVFSLTVITPEGRRESQPLPAREMLEIVAATNLKQRSRMAVLYHHAEARHHAVVGTANKNEHEQGFFVKYGDGGADIQPIGHLYKTQVYQMAEYLRVPMPIQTRTPTTDTYSAPCDQEEFFFRLPFQKLDLLWCALEHRVSAEDAAEVMGLTPVQVQRVYDDIRRKEFATRYLRQQPVFLKEKAP